jgi:hypothetical protein
MLLVVALLWTVDGPFLDQAGVFKKEFASPTVG